MTREQAQALTEKTLKLVTADDATVSLSDSDSAVTRYAGSAITQNVATRALALTVSVAYGGRRGMASAATLDPADIETAVRRAEAIAKLAPPDPEYLPPLGPQAYAPAPATIYDPDTAALTPEARAKQVATIVGHARKAGMTAAGTIESSQGATAFATSKGLFAYQAGTQALVGCTTTAKDSTGWARDSGPALALLNPDALAEDAIRQARLTAAPRALAPGRYTTILLPAAVGYVLSPILQGLSARETDEGVTFLSGKVGQKLVGDNVTLRAEPGNPRIPDQPFDGEGVPLTTQTLIDRGVFRTLQYDRFTAKKHGVAPNPRVVEPRHGRHGQERRRPDRGYGTGRSSHPLLVRPRHQARRDNADRHDPRLAVLDRERQNRVRPEADALERVQPARPVERS